MSNRRTGHEAGVEPAAFSPEVKHSNPMNYEVTLLYGIIYKF